MSKRHIPDSHTAHPNVTPLIDIIMCLIIFFMLVAKIGVTTGADEVDIPYTFRGDKIKDMSNTFTINVKNQTDANNIVVTALNNNNVVDTLALNNGQGQNQLTNTLRQYTNRPEFKVIIRADGKLPWRIVSPVLLSCNDAGIAQIAYNTKEGAAK